MRVNWLSRTSISQVPFAERQPAERGLVARLEPALGEDGVATGISGRHRKRRNAGKDQTAETRA